MRTAPQQTITRFLRKVGADALKQCKPPQGTGQRKLDVGMIRQFQEEVPSAQNSDCWRQCGLARLGGQGVGGTETETSRLQTLFEPGVKGGLSGLRFTDLPQWWARVLSSGI